MQLLRTTPSILGAASSCPDPALRRLLTGRIEALSVYDGFELSELVNVIIIDPVDRVADLDAQLGFSILINRIDGVRFGDPNFTPNWESIECHPGWFELTFILSDDGFGLLVFIPDREGIDPTLLELCRAQGHPPTN